MPRLIRGNQELRRHYHRLGPGDAVLCRVALRPGEEYLLLDLASRGVALFPPAMAQLASRSKACQARLLQDLMVPGTRVIHDRHDMAAALGPLAGARPLVCKLDRANAGHGILLFASVEEAHTQAMLGTLPYPFVLQPFVDRARDVRVIVIGSHVEAYERHNPDNFRHNMHWGGKARPVDLDPERLALCRRAMERAAFPYAHLDLLLAPDGRAYVSELNLSGGMRGARMDQGERRRLVAALEQEFLARCLG